MDLSIPQKQWPKKTAQKNFMSKMQQSERLKETGRKITFKLRVFQSFQKILDFCLQMSEKMYRNGE